MKKIRLAKSIAAAGIAALMLFNPTQTKAQDIIDQAPTSFYGCTPGTLEIPFSFVGAVKDSSVVIENISGFRLIVEPSPGDKRFNFCAANANSPCSDSHIDGKFQISFKNNSSVIGVKKVNFIIHGATAVNITVNAFQGTIPISITGSTFSDGLRYVYDNTTSCDYIEIVSVYNASTNPLTQAFGLDDLHLPTLPANQPPTDITLSANTVNENMSAGTVVGSFSTDDLDAGDAHTYSLVSGAGSADNGSFSISGTNLHTGAIFNYEAKSSYSIRVQTDDGHGGTFSKEFTININDVIELSSFTIVNIPNISVNENSTYTSVTPVISGTPIGSVTYAKGGNDAALFNIDLITGVVSMLAQNYESPVDANLDNVYEITITATDADNNSASESWLVTVSDVIEPATFTINTISNASINENSVYTGVTPVISGTPIGSVHYSLGGTDAGDFNVDAVSGIVTMAGQDFETPQDANTDNIYELTLIATDDDNNNASTSWTVTVTDVTETASFSINNISDASVNENNTYTSITPVITGTPVSAVTYSKEGLDAGLFTINSSSGVVSMVGRNYENAEDSNGDNIYEITIRATDTDNNSATENWTVTVIDVIETVTITIDPIPDITINENQDYTSVTPNITGTPIGNLHYSLGGSDAANFSIDVSTGVVSMSARDYENPTDINHDNVYEVAITATDDDSNSDSENWTVTINNLSSEGPPEVVCIIDLSISMNRDFYDHYTSNPNAVKLFQAKSALIAFADILYSFNPGIASFGLARFPNSPQVGCDAGSVKLLQILNTSYDNQLAADIPLLLADGGSTPLLAGIDFARNMFNSDNKKVMVLLTDGRQNCPTPVITDSMTDPVIAALNSAGILLYTIGFGENSLIPNNMLNKLATGTLVSGTYGMNYDITTVTKSPYTPGSPDPWDPATALHAAYANIIVNGLGLNSSTDPLDIINQNTFKQYEIPVTVFDSKVCFFVSWVTPQTNYLGVKLYTPDGNELILNQPGILSINRNNHTLITLSEAILNHPGMTGNWKLKIDGSNITGESEHYQYSVINSSKKLDFRTWFEREKYYTGDNMKIFLELMLEGNPVASLDSTYIKGIRPGEGLGKWLTSKKIDEKILGSIKQKKLEEYLKWTHEQPPLKSGNLSKQINNDSLSRIFLRNLDPIQLRAQVLKDEFKLTYPRTVTIEGLQFNDEGKDGDLKPGDGIYTAMHVPVKEGSYQFYVGVIDTSKGKSIRREGQLQKYINVRVLLKAFIKSTKLVKELAHGEKIYDVILKLRDRYGNVPAPDALSSILLSLDKGKIIDGITANPDGTFTQRISLPENIKPKNVTVTMTFDNISGSQKLNSSLLRSVLGIIIIILIGSGIMRSRKK